LAAWFPITPAELEILINHELETCTKEQREVFESYRVLLRKALLIRYDKQEYAFIVAQRGNEVMYYEDLEAGFNFSTLLENGSIPEGGCNESRLGNALNRWLIAKKNKEG
jgi:hypothetical protein